MGIKENIKALRETYNLSQKDLALIAGVSDKAVSTWENGTKEPRMGAIQKIADHFGLQKSNIIEDDGLCSQDGYYLDPEAAKMAQELYDNPGMRILFDAARNVSADDLKLAAEIIGRMKKEEEHDVD
ncbi:helix-turn-helix transcriptional regulator [Phascolarctobacterium faecium]|uniref:helix-turn-helix transcriptional regulator n=1 Tax=Phascolarctobacterium faecium TaxID=33025 RepID=UPI003AB568A7